MDSGERGVHTLQSVPLLQGINVVPVANMMACEADGKAEKLDNNLVSGDQVRSPARYRVQ